MKLKSIGDGIWIASTVMDFKAVKFPIRMTLLRLEGRDLMAISPIPPTPELIQQIKAEGYVKYIVAPNCMHHLHVNTFAAEFPEAQIWGPKDLQDKRRDISFTGVLDANKEAPWSAFVEMASVSARPPMFEEVAFFHKASKTAIVTDFLFNVQKFHNWFEKVVAVLNGGYKKLTMTRVGRRYFNDKNGNHKLAAKILTWNPENLVVAHGEVIVGQANLALREPLSSFAGANS